MLLTKAKRTQRVRFWISSRPRWRALLRFCPMPVRLRAAGMIVGQTAWSRTRMIKSLTVGNCLRCADAPRRFRNSRRRREADLQIISVDRTRSGHWTGTARNENKSSEWHYLSGSVLRLREQDKRSPRCWMNVGPPRGARQAVLRAVREARA